MDVEQGNNSRRHELTPYMVTVIPDQESLVSLYVELEGRVKLIVGVKIEENKELDSTFDLNITSKTSQLEEAYRVYTNQINRLIAQVAFLDKYKKTHFLFTVNLVEIAYRTDVLCHVVNALMLAIMLARVEMRYFPVSSTCFIDGSERVYTEDEANQLETKLTQVYICKNLANDDEIVSFKISGGHIDDQHVDRVFSFLCGSANAIGRKLLEFSHGLATN